jgi:hypothetical protein
MQNAVWWHRDGPHGSPFLNVFVGNANRTS